MSASIDAKVRSIIDFTSHLQKFLSGSLPSHGTIFAELPNYLAILPLTRSELPQQQRTQIRKAAISLWNGCNKSSVLSDIDIFTEKNTYRIRTLAFFLLESVTKHSLVDKQNAIPYTHAKHFHIGNETARSCLNAGQLEDAARIVNLLARKYGDILNESDLSESYSASRTELTAEFICLRIALEWKRGRLDLAEHQSLRLFSLIKESLSNAFPFTMIEKWLDLVYEIGVEELSQHRNPIATAWLRNARQFFDLVQDNSCYSDLEDMRLNILHALVRSLLGEGEANAYIEAMEVLRVLLEDYGGKLPVMLLELEVMNQKSKGDAPAIFARLMPIVRSAHLIDSNHKLIIFYIHRLFEFSQEHGTRALQLYITLRLVHQTNNDWTERAIITFLWMSIDGPDSGQDCRTAGVRSFLDLVMNARKSKLSAEAAHAGLVLLWKQIDKISTQTPDQGVLWCMIGLHQVFEKAGEDHIGKIERRMISCYHSLQDYESARITLSNMSSVRSAHHLSKYLAYCTYLKLNDEQETQSSLSAIISLPKTENRLLFACVSETMKHGSKVQSVRLLQRLLDKYSNTTPPEIDLPALLRCTAKLLFSIVDEPQVDRSEILTRLCHVLKAVVSYSTPNTTFKKSPITTLSLEDCRWFEQHSFNTAVEHLKKWPAKYVIDVLQYSSQMCFPPDTATKNSEINHRKNKHELAIAFIQAVLYTSEARSYRKSWTLESLPRTSFTSRAKPSDPQIQYTLYKNVFDRYCQIMQAYETPQQFYTQKEIEELHARLCTILPLGFEALLHMNGGSDGQDHESMICDNLSLIQIIDKAVRIEAPPKVYALLADLVLCAVTTKEEDSFREHPILSIAQATKILSKIVQAVRNLQVYDMNQAARWIRCIFQLIIDHGNILADTKTDFDTSPNTATNSTISLLKSIIDQAIMLATSAAVEAEPTTSPDKNHMAIDRDGDTDMANHNHKHDNNKPSHHKNEPEIYPPEELEYLATILFNMAVDFYVAGNEDQAKWYAGKAVEIADVLALPHAEGGDKGMLAKVLRQKTGSLGWVL